MKWNLFQMVEGWKKKSRTGVIETDKRKYEKDRREIAVLGDEEEHETSKRGRNALQS